MLSEQDLRELAQRKARFRGAYPVTYDDLGELWTAILNLLPLPEQPQSQICDTPAAKLHESAVAPLPPDPAPAEQVYTQAQLDAAVAAARAAALEEAARVCEDEGLLHNWQRLECSPGHVGRGLARAIRALAKEASDGN